MRVYGKVLSQNMVMFLFTDNNSGYNTYFTLSARGPNLDVELDTKSIPALKEFKIYMVVYP